MSLQRKRRKRRKEHKSRKGGKRERSQQKEKKEWKGKGDIWTRNCQVGQSQASNTSWRKREEGILEPMIPNL